MPQLPFKGYHYRSAWFYDLADLLKRGAGYNTRFRIAARYIIPGDAVVDMCSGPGRLQRFIPAACGYTAVEASPAFRGSLEKKGIRCVTGDLHQGVPAGTPARQVIVMIISLAQFRKTSAEGLLEAFKKTAARVVVVEEVLPRARPENSWFQRLVNYLCAADYYVPVAWYTREDFETLMRRHGYGCACAGGGYMVGHYEASS